MKLWIRYLKERWRLLTILGVCTLLFMLSFALYHLPVQAVAYPAMLCLLLGLTAMLLDLRRVKKRHDLLQSISGITDVMTGTLPDAAGIDDEDYQQILSAIVREYQQERGLARQKYEDMVDYYTVWAHQIKTPIASMRLHLQNEDSELSRKLSLDLLRVEQYVDMVLTFLRLNTDSTDYVIRACDLDGIIRQTVKKFAGEFIDRKLRLRYEPLHATVITDEKWMAFVVEQLLSNALKYTPSGEIAITLEPEKKLCIYDTGIGIAAEDLPRIFENGFTGYNGRMDKKASGIGLYLCKRICTNLGHRITVASQVDQGTCVTIDLEQRDLQVE